MTLRRSAAKWECRMVFTVDGRPGVLSTRVPTSRFPLNPNWFMAKGA